jgi:hypothetical protein
MWLMMACLSFAKAGTCDTHGSLVAQMVTEAQCKKAMVQTPQIFDYCISPEWEVVTR